MHGRRVVPFLPAPSACVRVCLILMDTPEPENSNGTGSPPPAVGLVGPSSDWPTLKNGEQCKLQSLSAYGSIDIWPLTNQRLERTPPARVALTRARRRIRTTNVPQQPVEPHLLATPTNSSFELLNNQRWVLLQRHRLSGIKKLPHNGRHYSAASILSDRLTAVASELVSVFCS